MTARVSLAVAESEAPPVTTREFRRAKPCTLVIFGAGDLLHRKLMPSLFHLMGDGLLPDEFAVITVARSQLDDDSFRTQVRDALKTFSSNGGAGLDQEAWDRFATHLHYVPGELDDPVTYEALRRRLAETDATLPGGSGHLFYLAIPPSLYGKAINRLAETGVAPRVPDPKQRPWVRIIIEKPFGQSLESAVALNACVRRAFAEHQVYRIDHYLGKETVQNLLVFRFANSIFEPVWNRQHVHHVQITAAESVGVEHRAKYYEEAGVVRDMFQNHLLQLLTLMAMEPPVTFNADAVRDEKVKVLRAIRPITPAVMHDYSVRGQYGPGTIDGKPVPGYRQEPDVAPDSGTATYCAIRFMIDNWRWQDVPFYLRSGKRMPRRATEIAIQFRKPPHLMFPLAGGPDHRAQHPRDPGAAQGRDRAAVRGESSRGRRQAGVGGHGLRLRRGVRRIGPRRLRDAAASTAWWARPPSLPEVMRWSLPGRWWIRSSTSGPASDPTTSPTTRRAAGGQRWPTSSSRVKGRSGESLRVRCETSAGVILSEAKEPKRRLGSFGRCAPSGRQW